MATRILCADDEPVNLMLLEAILVPRGYEVVKAWNGPKALDIIKSEPVDIVLLDVMMPGMNGHDVCKAIKADDRLREIPVIILTGLSAEQELTDSNEVGADGFITKPLHYPEVVAMIEKLLKVKRSQATGPHPGTVGNV